MAELNPPGTAIAVGQTNPPSVTAGIWESSGIIDTSDFFGNDTWLMVVQAHAPTLAPVPNTVEDGQLLLMIPVKVKIGVGSDDDNDK